METKERIPFAVNDYIQKNFREDFLFEVKDINSVNGHGVFTIEVSKDNFIHTLKFSENGALLNEEANEAFPPDTHEGQNFGEVHE